MTNSFFAGQKRSSVLIESPQLLLQTVLCMPYTASRCGPFVTCIQAVYHERGMVQYDPPLEPLTSTLAMIGNLAPRACANFLTSALLPGSWPPNCSVNTFQLRSILVRLCWVPHFMPRSICL